MTIGRALCPHLLPFSHESHYSPLYFYLCKDQGGEDRRRGQRGRRLAAGDTTTGRSGRRSRTAVVARRRRTSRTTRSARRSRRPPRTAAQRRTGCWRMSRSLYKTLYMQVAELVLVHKPPFSRHKRPRMSSHQPHIPAPQLRYTHRIARNALPTPRLKRTVYRHRTGLGRNCLLDKAQGNQERDAWLVVGRPVVVVDIARDRSCRRCHRRDRLGGRPLRTRT